MAILLFLPFPSSLSPLPPNDVPVGVTQKGLKNAVAISCITHMSEFGENFFTNHVKCFACENRELEGQGGGEYALP